MALIFPFDDSLRGHVEIVEMDMSQLEFPFFNFPKGSFFVDKLVGRIKDTRLFLRPGIDYRVMSLNEEIPFSDNEELNNKLRNNYVRNCVHWLGREGVTNVEWVVGYSGGEEESKPNEYETYIAAKYNAARAEGTLDRFSTPYQGWGTYVSHNNTQWLAGKNIYMSDYETSDATSDGKPMVRWGKLDLAFVAITEILQAGGDPLENEAMRQWLTTNATALAEFYGEVMEDLEKRIDALELLRVDYSQYVHSDRPYFDRTKPRKGTYVFHPNILLRGMDKDAVELTPSHPVGFNNSRYGFFGLLRDGSKSSRAVTLKNTKIFQRFEPYTIPNKNSKELVKGYQTYHMGITPEPTIAVDFKELFSTNVVQRLVVVSEALGLIYNNDLPSRPGTVLVPYPDVPNPPLRDNLFAYIQTKNNKNNASPGGVLSFPYVSPVSQQAYSISVDTFGTPINGFNQANFDDEDRLVVTVKRAVTTGESRVYVNIDVLDGSSLITTSGVFIKNDATGESVSLPITVNFAVGQSEVVLDLKIVKEILKDDSLVLFTVRTGVNKQTPLLAEVMLRYRPTATDPKYLLRLQGGGYSRLKDTTFKIEALGMANLHHRIEDVGLVVETFDGSDEIFGPADLKTVITRNFYLFTLSDLVDLPPSIENSTGTIPLRIRMIDENFTALSNTITVFLVETEQELALFEGRSTSMVTNDGVRTFNAVVDINQEGVVLSNDDVTVVETPEMIASGFEMVKQPEVLVGREVRFSYTVDETKEPLDTTIQFKSNGELLDECGLEIQTSESGSNHFEIKDLKGNKLPVVKLGQPFDIYHCVHDPKAFASVTVSDMVRNQFEFENYGSKITDLNNQKFILDGRTSKYKLNTNGPLVVTNPSPEATRSGVIQQGINIQLETPSGRLDAHTIHLYVDTLNLSVVVKEKGVVHNSTDLVVGHLYQLEFRTLNGTALPDAIDTKLHINGIEYNQPVCVGVDTSVVNVLITEDMLGSELRFSLVGELTHNLDTVYNVIEDL